LLGCRLPSAQSAQGGQGMLQGTELDLRPGNSLPGGRVRSLSEKEESKLREAIEQRTPQHAPAFDLSIHTGIRSSEQFSLRWPQIDWGSLHSYSDANQKWKTAAHPLECSCHGSIADSEPTTQGTEHGFALGVS